MIDLLMPMSECGKRAYCGRCPDCTGLVRCPGCGDYMDRRRALEANVALTQGLCSGCVLAPVQSAKRAENELRIAIFGENRTGSPAAFARCMEAEAR